MLSNKRITKTLIRLHRCAGWSPPLLFVNPEDRFSHVLYPILNNQKTSFKSKYNTRAHLIGRHCKSLCSRRNLMVFDLLTPPQDQQFVPRVKCFSVSWSTDHPLLFDMPHDHAQKIKFLTPQHAQVPPWGMTQATR